MYKRIAVFFFIILVLVALIVCVQEQEGLEDMTLNEKRDVYATPKGKSVIIGGGGPAQMINPQEL